MFCGSVRETRRRRHVLTGVRRIERCAAAQGSGPVRDSTERKRSTSSPSQRRRNDGLQEMLKANGRNQRRVEWFETKSARGKVFHVVVVRFASPTLHLAHCIVPRRSKTSSFPRRIPAKTC